MKDIKHTPIQVILDAAEPTLEKRTAEYVVSYNKEREEEIVKKEMAAIAYQKLTQVEIYSSNVEIRKVVKAYHAARIRPEMSDYIREIYKISLRMDLVVAMANYLYKTDTIASTPTFRIDGKKGSLIMETVIERNGVKTPLMTQVILVWGEIKAPHYRYRVETQLPKINAAPYLNWLQKVDKYESEIRSKQAYIVRQEQAREEAKGKGQTRLFWYNNDIKKANEQIVKLQAKIVAINEANV
jgi:hypothetical protein